MLGEQNRGGMRSSVATRRRFLEAITGVGVSAVSGITRTAAMRSTAQGDLVWKAETENWFLDAITVVDGTVYCVTEGINPLDLFAVDAEFGDIKWNYRPNRSADMAYAPTIVEDVVFWGSSNETGGRPNLMQALDASSGEPYWRTEIDGSVRTSPTLTSENLFFGSGDNNLYSLDPKTGEKKWTFEASGTVGASPIVEDGTVYFGSNDGRVYAVDIVSQEREWQYQTNNDITATPTIADGTVCVPSQDGNVYALDAETGDEQWRQGIGGGFRSSPTISDGAVYLTDEDRLYKIDVASGSVLWEFEADGILATAPTVTDETVFVGTRERGGEHGQLSAIDVETGNRNWGFSEVNAVYASPIVESGIVFFGGSDSADPDGGALYAVEAGVSGSSTGSRVSTGPTGHTSSWSVDGDVALPGNDGSTDSTQNQAESDDISVTMTETDEETRAEIEVKDSRDAEQIEIPLDIDISESLTLDTLELTTSDTDNFTLTLATSADQLDTTPESLSIPGQNRVLGYLSAREGTLDPDDAADVRFQYTVDRERFDQLGIDTDEMALYRYDDQRGAWVARVTTKIEETADTVVFETTAPSLSEWAAGAYKPEISITDAEIDVTTIRTGEDLDIVARLTNQGETDGVYVTRLLFDGDVVDERRPTVPTGGTVQIEFTEAVEETGRYEVTVNDFTVETVRVQAADDQTDDDGGLLSDNTAVLGGVGISTVAAAWYFQRSTDADDGDGPPTHPPNRPPGEE